MLLKLMKVSALLCLLSCISQDTEAASAKEQLPEVNGDIFYYFGYGSNMLTKRIHIKNPTAVKIGVGLLKDYRLDFNFYVPGWLGAPATIVPTENATVYGTVWEINLSNLDDIDKQEGVALGEYAPISVPVQLTNQTTIIARSYVLVDQPKTDYKSYKNEDVPLERQPSKTYLQCMVQGAIESGLPTEYVDWLKSLKHNGKVAEEKETILDLKDVKLSS